MVNYRWNHLWSWINWISVVNSSDSSYSSSVGEPQDYVMQLELWVTCQILWYFWILCPSKFNMETLKASNMVASNKIWHQRYRLGDSTWNFTADTAMDVHPHLVTTGVWAQWARDYLRSLSPMFEPGKNLIWQSVVVHILVSWAISRSSKAAIA